MQRCASWAALTLVVLGVGCGETEPAEELVTSVDLSAMDRSVEPCDDFYQFACGGWLKSHPLSDDASYDSRFLEPFRAEYRILQRIIDENLVGIHRADDPEGALVADFYRSCMSAPNNTAERTRARELLSLVDGVSSAQDLARAVARMRELGAEAFFSFYVGVDPGDARRHLAALDQGGLVLPDRQYYLAPEHETTRTRYREHMVQLTQLIAPGAAIDPDAVLRIETALANASLDRALLRDPTTTYNLTARADVPARVPQFDWESFWQETGVGSFQQLNVEVPSFIDALGPLLAEQPLEDVKSYLRWLLLEAQANALDQEVGAEEFDFHSRTFTGQLDAPPRWWRCYNDTVSNMGHALARPYVARYFGEESRTEARRLLGEVRSAFRQRLGVAPWLDASTRAEALAKLELVRDDIGFPDQWTSYAGLGIGPTSYLDNMLALTRDAYRSNGGLLSQPVEGGLWAMAPIEVNAYYSPPGNRMVFPAGILQLPFFAITASSASNFGGIGTVMGHELTHGFDDQGRHYDGAGSLRSWWTAPVEESFQSRAQCLVDQYSTYEALPGAYVNGALTLGENIADLGGLRVSYEALLAREAADGVGRSTLTDFDRHQEFFLAYAQLWCETRRPDLVRTGLLTDPHAPGRFRVNGTLVNLAAFAEAFQCASGSRMVHADTCEVW